MTPSKHPNSRRTWIAGLAVLLLASIALIRTRSRPVEELTSHSPGLSRDNPPSERASGAPRSSSIPDAEAGNEAPARTRSAERPSPAQLHRTRLEARERMLAERVRELSASGLGPRHPTLRAVADELETVRSDLAATE